MKLFLSIAVVTILLGTTAFAQEQSEVVNPQWFGYPHPSFGFYHPYLPHPTIPLPKAGAMPPRPPVSDGQMKCFQAFQAPGIASCIQDLLSFFQSHKVSVGSECCSTIQSVEDACKFQSPFLKNLVSNQCSGTPSDRHLLVLRQVFRL